MRAIGLDIHRGFCEVAIAADGQVRSARRVGTAPAELEAFAATLRADDVVTLEARTAAAKAAWSGKSAAGNEATVVMTTAKDDPAAWAVWDRESVEPARL